MIKFLSIALLCGAFLLLAGVGFAADGDVGANEVKLLTMVLTGPFGMALGLAVVFMGIWQFSQQNNAMAITLILAGVLITLSPGIYNGARIAVCPIAQALGKDIQC